MNGTIGVSLERFRQLAFRSVVLGAPGAGKSTLLAKLAYEYAGPAEEQSLRTPVHVTLRDYSLAREQRAVSLLRFIEEQIQIQLSVTPPRDAVQYLLLSGRAAILLDGLDELLQPHLRAKISQDIEAFALRYPSAPMIVTSRVMGYDEAPLNPDIFEERGISELETQALVDEFDRQSAYVSDLRVNALMLGLLCNLHQSGYRIPPNRAEVYEKCSTLLFDRWDEDRGIRVEVQARSHFRYAVAFLAYWIYSAAQLQSGVTEAQLVRRVSEYLERWLYDDAVAAEAAAREFVAFCRGRAWVFTDTGTTGVGEPLYQFTHRTFLEYFTAVHLVRISPGPRDLWMHVRDRLESGEWTVPAQSAVQMLDRQREGAGDAVLELLIDHARQQDTRVQSNLLGFAATLFSSFSVSPPVRVALARQVVESSVAINLSGELRERPVIPVDVVIEPLGDFVSLSGRPDLAALNRSIEEEVVGLLDRNGEEDPIDSDEQIVRLKVIIACRELLGWLSEEASVMPPGAEQVLRAAAPDDLFCASFAYTYGFCSLEDLIDWHGLRALFFQPTYGISKRGSSHGEAISDFLLARVIFETSSDHRHQNMEALVTLGELLNNYEFIPVVDFRDLNVTGDFELRYVSWPVSPTPMPEGAALIAITFLLCVLVETSTLPGLLSERGDLGPMEPISVFLASRREATKRPAALQLVETLYEGPFQASLRDWIRGERNFIVSGS